MVADVWLVGDGNDGGSAVTRQPGSVEVNPEPSDSVLEAGVVIELNNIIAI